MIEKFFTKPKTYAITDDRVYTEYNQWGTGNLEDMWFIRFLRANFPDNKQKINFFGPLGWPFFIRNKFDGKKVFYTPEDVEHDKTKLNLFYGDYALRYVDFAMGFGEHDGEKYLRFPYWILTTFDPTSNENDIIKRIQHINNAKYEKFEDCVVINAHDKKKTRTLIYEDVKDILSIKSAGRWRNNTDELWNIYKNDKREYLQRFKFNICAENDNTKYYVTEKLFDAFICGCIPLYYGSFNNPEPNVINRDAVIFWNDDGDNRQNIEMVKLLKNNNKEYLDFINQKKFNNSAAEYVIDRFTKLKEHMKRLVE